MNAAETKPLTPDQERRRRWMSVLAQAPSSPCREAFAKLGLEPGFDWLRPPEIGSAMVRGRMGGGGAPFNLGETTITRCALRLADGRVGHAHVAGRDREKARVAALCDALLQGPEAPRVESAVIEPMAALLAEKRARIAAEAEKTRVDFFTLVRGEDE